MRASRSFIALVLTISLAAILTLVIQVPLANAEAESVENLTSYQKLRAFGILEDNDDILYEDEITRGTFIKYALALAGHTEVKVTDADGGFSDVSPKDYFYNEVHFACRIGIISEAEYFYPERLITWSEASTILIKLLGYGGKAESKGGYPGGYLSVASSIDLFKKINISEKTISNAAFMQLMLNTLEVDLVSNYRIYLFPKGENKVVYQSDNNQTLLSEVFDIYEIEGVLNTTEYTSIYGESDISSDCVKIDNTIFYSDKHYYDMLGCSVLGYYRQARDEGQGTLIYAEIDDRYNQRLYVSSRDILKETITNNGFSYTDGSSAKTRKVSFEASVVLIYNGMQAAFSKELISKDNSYFTLIDYDNDRKYEVVRVMHYQTDIVDNIDSNGMLTGKFNPAKALLDPSDEDCTYIITKNGEAILPSEIKKDDIISYAEPLNPKKTVMYLVVSSNKIEGIATQIGDEKIIVEDKEHFAFDDVIKKCRLGSVSVFYLDAFGEIVYTKIERDRVFGYLYAIGRANAFDKIQARIFTENNRWVELDVDDRVLFNNKKLKAEDVLSNLGTLPENYRQLIMYNVNDDAKITAIWLAQGVQQWTEQEYEAIDTDVFRLTKVSAEEQYRAGMGSLGGEILLDNNTKIFMIPLQSTPGISEDDFYITSKDTLIADKIYYNISAYNCNEFGLAKAVVLEGNAMEVNSSSRLMLVKSVKNSRTMEDEEAHTIIGMYMGAEVDLQTQNEAVLNGISLKCGDVIQIALNTDGYIALVNRLYNFGNGSHQSFLNGSAYALASMYAGQVERIDSGSAKRMVIKYGTATGVLGLNNVTNVYLCKERDVEKISLQDILPGDYVFTNVNYFMAQEIVVFR